MYEFTPFKKTDKLNYESFIKFILRLKLKILLKQFVGKEPFVFGQVLFYKLFSGITIFGMSDNFKIFCLIKVFGR